jgi:hypothetical protein
MNESVPEMSDDDRELVIRLLNVRDTTCDRVASVILSAYCERDTTRATLDKAKAQLGSDHSLGETVEEALALARQIAGALLQDADGA